MQLSSRQGQEWQAPIGETVINQRFPENDVSTDGEDNPAIQLYGLRFYKDQTPIEYLAEFLLVFSSPKVEKPTPSIPAKEQKHAFSFDIGDGLYPIEYWPEDRIALKLFAFFPTSKLDTRHDVHQEAYKDALDELRKSINAGDAEKEETIHLLQSLFSGFINVTKTRTWVTQTFLPASHMLLAQEITWKHPEALKGNKKREKRDGSDWAKMCVHFDRGTHNFMGRGGELLFMQLAHLFHRYPDKKLNFLVSGSFSEKTKKLKVYDVRNQLQKSLRELLTEAIGPVTDLAEFCENILSDFKLVDADGVTPKEPSPKKLGWLPVVTITESTLFAIEAFHITSAELGSLEKLELLQTLCLMQVLRSLCFQGVRALRNSEYSESNDLPEIPGTLGNYCWICANPAVNSTHPSGKMAQRSMEKIESILYRSVRLPEFSNDSVKAKNPLENADDNCFLLLRKFGKELGLVVPRKGKGQRFVLPAHLLHFLVIALIEPGGRIPLDTFYERVFAHYGIALGPRQLAEALASQSQDGAGHHDYAVAVDTRWIEETLKQGDFLVELSDAVSIVRNPTAPAQRISEQRA